MTNAPLCTKPGGATEPGADAKIKTLADVTDNIYTTEAEAKSKPAAEIYVERAVAKVTVQNKTGELVANQNNAASKISYKLYNWAVDNTNKRATLCASMTRIGTNSIPTRLQTPTSTALCGTHQ